MAFKGVKRMMMKMGCIKLKARVLIVGLCNSGKTTIVRAVAGKQRDGTAPTAGFEVETLRVKKVKLTTFDMSGQAKYQTLWDDFYLEANGVVFVVDAANSIAMPEAKAALDKVVTKLPSKDVPILIVCNKMDVADAMQPEQVESALGVSKLTGRTVRVMPCTALQNQGVDEAMVWLLRGVRSAL